VPIGSAPFIENFMLPVHEAEAGVDLADDLEMGFDQLQGERLVEPLERQLPAAHDAQHLLQQARDEEELLLETQRLALGRFVVRVQDLGDVLGDDLAVDRTVVVAAVEHREGERLGRLGAPQAQRVGGVRRIAEDRRVAGHAIHREDGDPACAQAPADVGVTLHAAAEGTSFAHSGHTICHGLPKRSHLSVFSTCR
jgi:hypothetical protein